MTEGNRSDAELLAATPGDPDAFSTFYRRHVREVWSFVARDARPDDVGDLVAEVFAIALVHRRRFDPGRGTGGAWLTGIARHKMIDVHRRRRAETQMCRRLGIHLPDSSMEGPVLDGGAEVLAVLSPEQRRALSARVLEDKSYEQIAHEESVSAQAVRKRVSRALAALRSHLQEEP